MSSQLDWESQENHFFLNPRIPQNQAQLIHSVGQQAAEVFQSHIFLLSSGTTARSVFDFKWVALSKQALLSSAESVNHFFHIQKSDLWLNVIPDFHVGGLAILARSFLSQSKVISHSVWNVDLFLKEIHEKQVTLTAVVPAQVYDCVIRNYQCPPSLRVMMVGAGALSPQIESQAKALGWPIVCVYGMTEAGSQIAVKKQDALGFDILPHLEVESSPEQYLRIRGSSLFSGYVFPSANHSQNSIRIVRPIQPDGWFHSEDLGEVSGGVLHLAGRSEEWIKIGGESVALSHLNGILDNIRIRFGVLSDIALVAVPDPRLGHVIHAIGEKSLSLDLAQKLLASFAEQVMPFEKIRQFHFLEEIPRTALGKLRKSACLEKLGFSRSIGSDKSDV